MNLKETDTVERKLRLYVELLACANRRARLTGPADPETLYREHVLDAMAGLPWLPEGKSFVDVGTGGRLPGLVWYLCRPDLRGVLIDSVRRKVELLQEMASALGCSNATILHTRSEELARNRREDFFAATGRAVTHSCILAEYLSPLVRPGGRLIAFKGPAVRAELAISEGRWGHLGLGAPKLYGYKNAGKEGFVVIWDKLRPAPSRYPRAPGMATKKPWCRLPEKPTS